MKLTKIQTTAIAPSSFGMPNCGHATARTIASATTTVVRDRQAGIKGEMGLAFAYVPGTSAWSPPLS